MPNGNERAELRRIMREALQLYHRNEISEEELREIAFYAMTAEMTIHMSHPFTRLEQKIQRRLEHFEEKYGPMILAGVSA